MNRAEDYKNSKQLMGPAEFGRLEVLEDRLRYLLKTMSWQPQGRDWHKFTDAQEEYVRESSLSPRIANNMARNCLAYLLESNRQVSVLDSIWA